MSVLLSCMFMCPVCAQCPERSKKSVGSPEIRIRDACEPPCGCWNQTYVLQKNKIKMVLPTESSLQPFLLIFRLLGSDLHDGEPAGP